MRKNNTTRKTKKKRNKVKKERQNNSNNDKRIKIKSSGPVFISVDNPFSNTSEIQRKDIISELMKNGSSKIIESFDKIEKILRVYDPIKLLAIVSGYGLTVVAGDKGVQSKEDKDGINQSDVELLQALSLQLPADKYGQRLVTPDVVEIVWDSLIELSKAFQLSRLNSELLGETDKNIAVNQIQEMMRSNTQGVRNWGYYSQVKSIAKEIYSHFDPIVEARYGFTPSDIIEVFSFMLNSVEQSLTSRCNILKELKSIKRTDDLILRYHKLTGLGEEETSNLSDSFDVRKYSVEDVFIMLLSHYDLKMAENYYFNVSDIANSVGIENDSAQSLLDYFSYSVGDLLDFNKEYFFLDNPIWNKPIVKINDRYFCPMPQLFFSFVLTSLDSITESIDKQQLHARRAIYLENKIDDIVKTRFPEALTISGLQWKLKGIQYETDLITFIDSHAIIIEAKSQKITKPALRGAPGRVKRHIKDILIEPSIQSKRLETRLNELRLNPELKDPLRDEIPIDLNKIHKILRVSVSLEDFASLQSNLSRFKETGWVPDDFSPCPTMNLADFETLFDFLEHPVQIIHYLQRRTELEGNVNFLGHELDFMGMYITTLLHMGNIDIDCQSNIIISGMSEPLDKYYSSKDQGILLEKPRPKVSKLFNDIFLKLEERSTPQWTEIGVLLNMFPPDVQSKLTSNIRDLTRIVNRGWKKEGHKNMIIFVPAESSEYALVYVLYKNSNASRRDEFIEHATYHGLKSEHVKRCLVIAKNIDNDSLPYQFIALVENNN